MQNNNLQNIVTTIDGIGTIEAPNDLAHFTLTVKSKHDQLDQAKSQTEDKTAKVMATIESLKAKGMKLEGDVQTISLNYKLEHREGRDRMPAGHQTTTTIQLTTIVDDSVDDVYKAFLQLDPYMSRPIFSIKDRDIHINNALQQATDNAKDKLNKECDLLGIDPKNLSILDWHFGYEGNLPSAANFASKSNYYGATGMVGNSSFGPMMASGIYASIPTTQQVGSIYQELLDYKIVPGVDNFKVAVRVNYVWVK